MYETILVAIDDSDTANEALEHAIDLADAVGARLHVLSVVEPSGRLRFGVREVDQLNDAVRELVDDVVAAADGHDERLEIHPEIRRGRPSEIVLAYADEVGADLVLVGQQGESDLSEKLLGSTTDRVARQSTVPVTIVPRTQTA
ncbi:universal stress protein [Halobacteria archaeon AArc-m2/3/4]|uniref:Universal stress protein n=1 Tax=Natronoglomus mannanivorans TaxID=2979990 RepID=A0AAP2Z5D1_9EURY|nr:universal stress protein [Halobacteria archaeon AArc-xg1-1]MCU4974639.1 universal stress protein [Halobacteria archaeon AArc-m2/3/4]